MKKAILSLLILISFSAFSQNVVIFQNGNTQPMQFITDSLKQRVDSCSTAIQNGGGVGGVTTGTPNSVRYFNADGRDTSDYGLIYQNATLNISAGADGIQLKDVLGEERGLYDVVGIIASYGENSATYKYANGAIKSTPTAALDVVGNAKVTGTISTGGYTVATLPTGTLGMMAYVTDATTPIYLAAVVGGGAVFCPVIFDGTGWISH